MSALKDLFDAEQKKISDQRHALQNADDQYFNEKVLPVISGVLAEINKDSELSATYSLQREFSRGNNDIPVNIIISDKAGNELGRAQMTLDGVMPTSVTIENPKSQGLGRVGYSMDRDALAFQYAEMPGGAYEISKRLEAGEFDKAISQSYASAARTLVMLAAENSMDDPQYQRRQKAAAPVTAALRP